MKRFQQITRYFFALVWVVGVSLLLNTDAMLWAQDGDPNSIPSASAAAAFNESFQLRQSMSIAPSPNPASLGQFGQYELSHFTGALNLMVPIHTIQGQRIQHNVGLSYNSSSIKVEAEPSWTGLGWNLNAGGVVTRIVKGFPDEDNSKTFHKYYGEDPLEKKINDLKNEYGDSQHPEIYELYTDIEKGIIETQPDEFQLSAGGISATFIITNDRRVITKKRTGLKIKPEWGSLPLSLGEDIVRFKVTDLQGHVYTFDKIELTKMTNDVGTDSENDFYRYVTSWFLSSIDVMGTSESLEFCYDNIIEDREKIASIEKTRTYTKPTMTVGQAIPSNPFPCSTPSSSYGVNPAPIQENRWILTDINYKENGTILESLSFSSSDHTFHSTMGDRKLDNIILTHYNLNPSGSGFTPNELKKWKFRYDNSTNRLTLKTIQEMEHTEGDETGIIKPPHEFKYYEGELPDFHSNAIDHWGYYNGKDENTHLIPAVTHGSDIIGVAVIDNEDTLIAEGANRSADEESNKVGVLKKIIYPTGGAVKFRYELNDTNSDTNICTDCVTQSNKGGGLRLQSALYFDEGDAGDSEATRFKKYNYITVNNTSSGRFFTDQIYYKKIGNYFKYSDCGSTNGTSTTGDVVCERITIMNSSIPPLQTVQGGYVGYSRVEEIWTHPNPDNETTTGKRVFHYRNHDIDNSDYWSSYSTGELIQEQIFNRAGDEIRRTVNNYTNPVPADKVKPYGNNGQNLELSYEIYKPKVSSNQNNYTRLCQAPISNSWVFALYSCSSAEDCIPETIYNNSLTQTKYGDENGEEQNVGWVAVTYWSYMDWSETTYFFYDEPQTPPSHSLTTRTDYAYDNDYIPAMTSMTTTNTDGKVYRTEIGYPNDFKTLHINTSNPNQENTVVENTTYIYTYDEDIPEGEESISSTDYHYTSLISKNIITLPVARWNYVDDVFQGAVQTHPDGSGKTKEVEHTYADFSSQIVATLDYHPNGFPASYQAFDEDEFHEETFVWQYGLLKEIKQGDHIQTYDYHDDKRLVEYITGMDGLKTSYHYDGLMRLYAQGSHFDEEGYPQVVNTYNYKYALNEESDKNQIETIIHYTEVLPWEDEPEDALPNQISTVTFDALGRQLTKSINGIEKEAVIYDEYGRVAQQTYLPGIYKTIHYDGSPLNRVIGESYPDGTTTQKKYDCTNDGFFTETMIDENGNAHTSYKNKIGQLVKQIDPIAHETNYAYYDNGLLHTVHPPEGDPYEYDYYPNQLLREKTIPDGGTYNYDYTDGRLLEKTTDPNGNIVNFVYDKYGRETLQFKGDLDAGEVGTLLVKTDYDYDSEGNGGINMGKVVKTTTKILDAPVANLESTMNYDNFGRLKNTTADNHIGGQDYMEMTYNLADLVTQQQRIHQGYETAYDIRNHYTFDQHLRPKTSSLQLFDEMIPLSRQHYNDLDQLTQKDLLAHDGSTLQEIDYTYNNRGWLTHINKLNPEAGSGLARCEDAADPCADLCDYWVNIRPADNEIVMGIHVQGRGLADLNYPYGSNEASLEQLKNDLSAWLSDHACINAGVKLDQLSNGHFQLFIKQSDLIFTRIMIGDDYTVDNPTGDQYFFSQKCTNGQTGTTDTGSNPMSICDQCAEMGLSCDECDYWKLDDPCNTCAEMGISDCTACMDAEDICTQCEKLGYFDCYTCPLTVNSIAPKNLEISFNLATFQEGYARSLIQIKETADYHLADGTSEIRVYERMAKTAEGDKETANLTHSIVVKLSDLKIVKGNEQEVIEEVLYRLGKELHYAGVEDEGNIVMMQYTVRKNLEQAWLGKTTSSEAPNIDTQQDTNADLFALALRYGDVSSSDFNDPTSTPSQYNGNIAAMQWQVNGRNVQHYGFTYDANNRLTNAVYAEQQVDYSWNMNDKYGVGIGYDPVGNIQNLARRGVTEICPHYLGQPDGYEFGSIDQLTYSYTGNRLTSITDNAHLDFGFKSEMATSSFAYDNAGNMRYYGAKGMNIDYNHLNLPTQFAKEDGTGQIDLLYDATGAKLQKRVTDNTEGNESYTQDYLGGLEYKNEQLEAIYHEEGKITLTPTGYQNEYYLKDHLGNIRVVFADKNQDGEIEPTKEILQENHFYPFGMAMDGFSQNYATTGATNRYTYNGKELNVDLGLDMHDYGARWYMADLSRWGSMDPLAEKYYPISSYVYVANNPMIFVDPNGMEIDISKTFQHFDSEEEAKAYIQDNLLADLRDKTGLSFGITDNNTLEITGSDGEVKSETLKGIVEGVVADEKTLNLELNPNGFLSAGNGDNISIGGLEIEYNMTGTSTDLNQTTYGWGLTFAHEYDHTSFGSESVHSEAELNTLGSEHLGLAVGLANQIRQELTTSGDGDYGQRLSYKASPKGYFPFKTAAEVTLKANPNADLRKDGGFVNKQRYVRPISN